MRPLILYIAKFDIPEVYLLIITYSSFKALPATSDGTFLPQTFELIGHIHLIRNS